jgi:crotonobetainyl-CoA:carnitine CoA-transferase CaiB-like acyl-CoA transferase
MAAALAGIRVFDLTDSIAGQFCGRMLADYGAEVLLAEPPDGSAIRRAAPLGLDGESFLFFHLNAGKQSVLLDRADEPRLRALAAAADVVLTDRPTEHARLAAALPGAVVALVSLFGADGPWRDWAGSEMIHQAIGGVMHASGSATREPLYGCADRASYGAGVAAAIAVLAALFARGRWGIGQAVSVDIAETATSMANPFISGFLTNGLVEPRIARRSPLGQVRCPDGWVGFYLHVHLYKPMCDKLGLPELATDPRFENPKNRLANFAELTAEIQAHAGDWPAETLLARLQAARVVAARSYSLTELRDDCPHLTQRHFWETVATPAGPRTILGPQFRLSATPRHVKHGPPSPGSATGFTVPARALPLPAAPAPGTGPLTGLRVVELTTAWAGPMAGRVLAWLGAETIHVESASRLDSWRQHNQVFNRYRYPPDGAGARPWDRTCLFNSQNANKLSLTLELKHPKAHAAMLRLMAKSDVVLCNFTAGTLARMGFGHDVLKALNPAIIVAEMPAFGASGPMSHATAIGPSMEMAAGMAGMIGYPGGKPTTTGPTYPDPIGAYHGAAAVLTALVARQASGHGQHVEIPQVEAAMHYIGEHILHALATGDNPTPNGNRVAWAAPHDAVPAAGEDQWLAVAVQSDAAWQSLCAVIARPDLARHATLAARRVHEDELLAAIAAWSRGQDKHEAAVLLQSRGIAAAAVHDGRDGTHSPYLVARDYFTELHHPDVGRIVQEGMPFHLAATPGANRTAAPVLGQHTHDVLSRIIGLSAAEIAELDDAGLTSAVPK